jgi:diguanylate cyclase (GGDEF)-like protein
LILIDIDYFKAYNDSHGHLGGDYCLKLVATSILSSLRASDFAARYGGEEFICLLHETGEEGTRIVAERIRSKIESINIPHGASPVSPWVTISLGVATCKPAHDSVPEELIRMADRLLYKAKEHGRNRIEQAVQAS